jgi:transcriptional regulator with XRE-family HTH domain
MPDSFGARLRQCREERNISLATIAEKTKIQASLLEGLERDDVSRWPSGIFRRAFIRSYADSVGLDADAIARQFLERYPDPEQAFATAVPIAGAADAEPIAPPTRFRDLMGKTRESLGRLVRPGHEHAPRAMETSPRLEASPAHVPRPAEPDFFAAAELCREFGRLDDTRDALPLLRRAAALLDAVGLIVWVWDRQTCELTPTLAVGYSPNVLAHVPRVKRDAGNATAAAFRSGRTSIVTGRDDASDALAIPLMTSAGSVGVFAVELPHGAAQYPTVRAWVTIVAVQLTRLIPGRDPEIASSEVTTLLSRGRSLSA